MNVQFAPFVPYGELRIESFDIFRGVIDVYLHFYIPVIGISASSLTIENGVVDEFCDKGGNTYSYTISAIKYGLVKVVLEENVCSTVDLVMNPKSNVLHFDYRAPLNNRSDVRIFETSPERQKRFQRCSKVSIDFSC